MQKIFVYVGEEEVPSVTMSLSEHLHSFIANFVAELEEEINDAEKTVRILQRKKQLLGVLQQEKCVSMPEEDQVNENSEGSSDSMLTEQASNSMKGGSEVILNEASYDSQDTGFSSDYALMAEVESMSMQSRHGNDDDGDDDDNDDLEERYRFTLEEERMVMDEEDMSQISDLFDYSDYAGLQRHLYNIHIFGYIQLFPYS
eukprot:TRINITY_DN732_c0_g1_i4.p2 TRINITY_DN732_c0_g1~~TRINITY_DN732_c0_g1_i4.p2  ORF type:complete len:201 (+),score=42.80 TRINITY_DN732_c0_g1_i4:787-1389(+)